jgi:hypothetical protein
MDCREAHTHLLDRRRGTLGAASRTPLESHLAGCEACRGEDAADALLSEILAARLSRRRAPASLRRSLEARWDPPSAPRAARLARGLVTMAAGAALAVLVLFATRVHAPRRSSVARSSSALRTSSAMAGGRTLLGDGVQLIGPRRRTPPIARAAAPLRP